MALPIFSQINQKFTKDKAIRQDQSWDKDSDSLQRNSGPSIVGRKGTALRGQVVPIHIYQQGKGH